MLNGGSGAYDSVDLYEASSPRTSRKNKVTQLRAVSSPSNTAEASRSSGEWYAPSVRKLCQLLTLQAGWDSYRAPPIGQHTAMFALQVLNQFMRPGVPNPSIVPSSIGGVQMEWHDKGIDFEIHVTAPYELDFFFEDSRTHAEYGDSIKDDLAPLFNPFAALSR